MNENNVEVRALKQSLQEWKELFELIAEANTLDRAKKLANEAMLTAFSIDVEDDPDYEEDLDWEDLDDLDQPDLFEMFK